MSGYYVFFRCWPGFSESFPFEQFDALPDKELAFALDSLAVEQVRLPDVRRQIKRIAKRRRKAVLEGVAAAKGQFLTRPGKYVPPPKPRNPPSRPWISRRCEARGLPLICRVGGYLGWYDGRRKVFRGPAPLVYFQQTRSMEFAEQLVEILNDQRTLDYKHYEIDHDLNIRYGFAEATSLESKQRATAKMCINALQEGKGLRVEEPELAAFIGQRAVEAAKELANVWPEGDPPGDLQTRPSAASATATAPKKKPGGKTTTDAKADRRVAEAWRTGQYRTKADLAIKLGMTTKETKQTLDRHRHRTKK